MDTFNLVATSMALGVIFNNLFSYYGGSLGNKCIVKPISEPDELKPYYDKVDISFAYICLIVGLSVYSASYYL